jgi:hypothetical protein
MAAKTGEKQIAGWRAVCGCSSEGLALFRISLGFFLTLELVLRFRVLLPFYSDQGTLPLALFMPNVDDLYRTVCFHCHFGDVWQQQVLLSIQVALAVLFTLGIQTRLTSILSWYLYFSLTLRNTWMNYILDRYFHYLLFLSMFLPLQMQRRESSWTVTPATVFAKLLVIWIYVDAGYGKWVDPLGGWTYHADPLPALDTYARHTLVAQYMYAILGPGGLRLMTPVVVYVELLAAPVAILGLATGIKSLVYTAVVLICALHVGIALTLRNAALLSFVACTAWCLFLPIGSTTEPSSHQQQQPRRVFHLVSFVLIGSMAVGNLLLGLEAGICSQSVKHIWSTLLHNRWNVFVGAEEYVTWEIAPGLLEDGSIVDIWSRTNEVNWSLPGAGAVSIIFLCDIPTA